MRDQFLRSLERRPVDERRSMAEEPADVCVTSWTHVRPRLPRHVSRSRERSLVTEYTRSHKVGDTRFLVVPSCRRRESMFNRLWPPRSSLLNPHLFPPESFYMFERVQKWSGNARSCDVIYNATPTKRRANSRQQRAIALDEFRPAVNLTAAFPTLPHLDLMKR